MSNLANIKVDLSGNVFEGVKKLQTGLDDVVTSVKKVDKSVNKSINEINQKFAEAIKKINKQLTNINYAAVVDNVRNVTEAISNISGPGIGFEQKVAELSAITGIAGKELDGLEKKARQVGVSSGLGAEGAVEAYKLLASQIQVDKIGIEGLNMLHQETITLAQASGMSMADAANSMAGTINQFGLEATEANRVINVLAAGSKYGAAEIPELAQSFKVVGAAANAAGLSVEQTAGAIEVLSKNNLKGAEAGTSLRNIVLKMQTTLGMDFTKVSLADALESLKPKLSDASYLAKVFGVESIAAAQFLIANSDAVKEMTESVTDTNVAQEQAAITTETTAFKMQQWRAQIDDVKIGLFNLMGSSAGFLTVLGENMVMFAQMMPLLKGIGTSIIWLTKVQNLQKVATVACNVVTGIWTGIQWALNAALWACPLTWIIAAVIALIGVIVWLCTSVEGWGKQWDSVVNFAKNCWELLCESITFSWNVVSNGIMIGINVLKKGWYGLKSLFGSDSAAAEIAKINADTEARQREIIEGARKVQELKDKTANSLSWELSLKKDKEGEGTAGASPVKKQGAPVLPTPDGLLDLGGSGGGSRGGSGGGSSSGGGVFNLDSITPQNQKGTSAYGAIVSKLSGIQMPSLATAAATLAMPLAVATTTPKIPAPTTSKFEQTETLSKRLAGKTINVKACDKIEIHIDSANGQGYSEIEKRINTIAQKAASEMMLKIIDDESQV